MLLGVGNLASTTFKPRIAKPYIKTPLKNNNVSNISDISSEAKQTLSSHLTTVFLPIVYIIVLVVGLPANALAVWVFLFRVKKKCPPSIYMANLALDLMFVIWVPLKIAYHFNNNDWIYGEALCKVLSVSSTQTCTAPSVHHLLQRAALRSRVYPFSKLNQNNRVAIAVSVTVWVTVWITTVPLYLCDQVVRVPSLDIATCHDVTEEDDIEISAVWITTVPVYLYDQEIRVSSLDISICHDVTAEDDFKIAATSYFLTMGILG
ncbi:hypothetical protein WMY93_031885 [Mugilogobius chulae]|uniref:G-protein coupled receptors family 1 profile domain-containing protein n=1 Tax=Mugilogobius chulae TaxID=88201 RepID=A0AAW0MLI7_9GOBI